MTQHVFLFLSLGLLAGCGADGAPRPPADTPEPGITISGEASFGVVRSE